MKKIRKCYLWNTNNKDFENNESCSVFSAHVWNIMFSRTCELSFMSEGYFWLSGDKFLHNKVFHTEQKKFFKKWFHVAFYYHCDLKLDSSCCEHHGTHPSPQGCIEVISEVAKSTSLPSPLIRLCNIFVIPCNWLIGRQFYVVPPLFSVDWSSLCSP